MPHNNACLAEQHPKSTVFMSCRPPTCAAWGAGCLMLRRKPFFECGGCKPWKFSCDGQWPRGRSYTLSCRSPTMSDGNFKELGNAKYKLGKYRKARPLGTPQTRTLMLLLPSSSRLPPPPSPRQRPHDLPAHALILLLACNHRGGGGCLL